MLKVEPTRKWIEALRSGEYKQCFSALSRPDNGEGVSFCCLGVAAIILPNAEAHEDGVAYNIIVRLIDGEEPRKITDSGFLSDDTANEYGIRSESDAGIYVEVPPKYFDGKDVHTAYGLVPARFDTDIGNPVVDLSRLNDKYMFNFEQIADFLEWVLEVQEEENVSAASSTN